MAESDTKKGTQVNEPFLRVEELTKKFGSLTAVDDVTLTIDETNITAVIGPNGAGKTTLLRLLSGEMPPTSGNMEFKGKSINGLSQAEICRRGIAKSYQSPSVFPTLSVKENIRLSVQRRYNRRLSIFRNSQRFSGDVDRTREIMDQFYLGDLAEESAESLSHGDKKKLGLAITIATDPDILLLDEPLAGVSDSETEALIKILKELSNEYAILWVEHDIKQVLKNSDQIYVMHMGKIIATGTAAEIKQNEHVQEVYLT